MTENQRRIISERRLILRTILFVVSIALLCADHGVIATVIGGLCAYWLGRLDMVADIKAGRA